MPSISSPGIGSGLDISGIVSKLVALERQPLVQLQKAASSAQSRLSLYGQVKSQLSTLEDAAQKLGSSDAWTGMTVSSSNPAAISANAAPGSSPAGFSVEVTALAKKQVTVVAPGQLGNGSLTLHSWATGAFVSEGGAAVTITIDDSANTLAAIASNINSSASGVEAMVVQSAEGERLVLRSTQTGADYGFDVSFVPTDGGQGQEGADLSFTTLPPTQPAQDARFLVDGLEFKSSSNSVAEALPGVSLKLTQVTTAPVEIKLEQDKEAMKKSIQALVDAYNTVNSTLANAMKYNPETKSAAPLQGDSTAVGLQGALRSLMRTELSGQSFERLQDLGISFQSNGSLAVNSSKLEAALDKPADLKDFFASSTSGPLRGFGLQVADFVKNALSSDGRVTVRTEALQAGIKRNSSDQELVNVRAERMQARLLEVYNAMDTKVGRLNSINNYVSQQLSSLK